MSTTTTVSIHLDPEDAVTFQVREHEGPFWAIGISVGDRKIVTIFSHLEDQVREFVPDFRSTTEKAAAIAPLVAACEEAHGPAMAEARPFQVGDKVRVLRVPGLPDAEPYDSQVVLTDWADGGLLVRSRDGRGWEYEEERVWYVGLANLELIAPAEVTA